MIWILGNKGQSGSEICHVLNENKISWIASDAELDVCDTHALEKFVLSHDHEAGRTGSAVEKGKVPEKITWVINCLEYQDFSETDEAKIKAENFNVKGALNIARLSRQLGAKLIHISSAYVYEGEDQGLYTEESLLNPITFYGKTKVLAEEAIQKEMNQYYIIRPGWLYGFEGNNLIYNLIRKIAYATNASVLNDKFGMPLSARDLANLILKIILTSEKAKALFGKKAGLPYGIYNFASSESVSLYDLAGKLYDYSKRYKKITNDCDISAIYGQDDSMDIFLPPYLNLDCKKIIQGLKIKKIKWTDSLEKFVKDKNFIPGKF